MHASHWPRTAVLGALAAYVVALLVPALQLTGWVTDGVLAQTVLLVGAAVLLRRDGTDDEDQVWAFPLTVGVCLLLVGRTLSWADAAWPGVSLASVTDTCRLGSYPCLLVALLVALQRRLRGVRPIVLLDGLSATLAGAAAATWVVAPLVDVVRARGPVAGHVLGPVLAYAGCGVVLLGAALGALGMVGRARGWSFVAWTSGTAIVGAAAVAHAYALVVGGAATSWLEAVGPVGVTLVVAGATQAAAVPRRPLPRERSMAVAAVASAGSVVVLAAGPTWSQGPLPSALALGALLGCGVRLGLVFLQLRELAAMREQALTDELTGVANRRAFHAELDRVFGEDADDGGTSDGALAGCCVGLIDLDHFKEVNDTYGHAAGDELLRAVVSRFRGALQELQTPHLFARLGGDEFAVVLHQVTTPEAALACGEALQESLLEPVPLDEVVLHAQASIGMALAPEHGRDRGDMLFAADVAMYSSKTSGEPVCIYSPSEDGDRRGRLEVAEDLFGALERGELTVEYQPIMTVGGDLAGSEALVRWDHPTRGRLSPGEFLAVAENHRLTVGILERVLDVALHDLHRWRAGGSGLRMSVNVTASDLSDEGLVGVVAAALRRHDVPAWALTIEVTESAMMRNAERTRAVMSALSDLGVQLAVDAYGTGYSGLAYLLNLPVSEIKLDAAFAASLVDDPRAVAIVRSAVDLAHALGLRMVAEGVEDGESRDILAELGCDLVQGWHVGRPVPAARFGTLLSHQGGEHQGVLLA